MKTYKLFSVIAILALLFVSLPVLSVGAAACTTTLNPGDDIQTAINSATPGDVICLNPGIYSPPVKININKTVTLQGPQAGIDPRPSAGTSRVAGDSSTEAIIDGAVYGLSGIIVVTADNVVLDGLEVRNGSGDMIDSESSLPISGVVLKHNIIDGATGDEAIQIRACTDCVIEFNHIFDIAQDGINMCCGSTGGTIRFNEVHDNYSENAAIYLYDATNLTVQCNLVYDVYGNDGIKLGAKNGDDAALSGGSILNNVVHHTEQDGISIYTSDTLIDGNEVYNSTSENGAIYVAQVVSNIMIENNYIHDNTLDAGKWGDPSGILIGTGVDAATVSIHNNNIVNNSVNGVTNKAAALLDATSNWWGAADGPSGVGPGSGDAVGSNVDFNPWLAEAVVIPNPCVLDDEGPITTSVLANPNPVSVGNSVTVTANVDDTDRGDSNIASAEYSLDGDPWTIMSASDGAFDDISEDVTANFTAPSEPGIYALCVRGTDEPGNVGDPECFMLVVYDPSGGFVTGGGWIDLPEGAMAPTPMLVWDQDFSLDDAGWFDDDDDWYGDITVADGTATFFGDNDSGPFSRFDGYRDVWPGTWVAEIDVYLDPAWPSGQGFDYSVAATGSDGNHQRDYIFHVGVVEDYDPITGRALLVNGSNNADFTTNPYKLVNDNGGSYYVVNTAGWYTLQHVFRDAGGYLAVDLNLLDSSGNTLWAATRENVADTIPGEVGGNRYAWFTHIDVADGIQVDNHQLYIPVSPTGKATFGFVSKYKKGADVPDGNTEFQFKAGDLNFHSTSYDWLVVTGSNYAKFKGTGTINGQGNYKFQIWAGDETGQNGEDEFRIKIWDAATDVVVYDNSMDQAIGGGSIVVHTAKK